jgi:hypothetical protein
LQRIVAGKLKQDWSPQQIAGWLRDQYPESPEMWVSHETIYRSLFVQARGALKKELIGHLRSSRSIRRPRHAVDGRVGERILDAVPKEIQNSWQKKSQTIESLWLAGQRAWITNVIERAVILSDDDIFCLDETWLKRQAPEFAGPTAGPNSALQRQEKEMIDAALAETAGRVSGPGGAAAKLWLPRPTLDAKIRRLGINKYRFKVHQSN